MAVRLCRHTISVSIACIILELEVSQKRTGHLITKVSGMSLYLVSDLHLDHENVIRYCDRPFTDVEDMNQTLVTNWNSVVAPADEVIFGGDLTISGSSSTFLTWTDQLHGELIFFWSETTTIRCTGI